MYNFDGLQDVIGVGEVNPVPSIVMVAEKTIREVMDRNQFSTVG